MDEITQYVLPRSTLPRYDYAAREVFRLNKKSQRLIRKCGLKDPTEVVRFDDVTLNIQSRKGDTFLKPTDILTEEPVDTLTPKRFVVNELERSENEAPFHSRPEVWTAPLTEDFRKLLPEHFGRLTILVSPKDEIDDRNRCSFIKIQTEHESHAHGWIIRTTKEEFAQELNNILEHHVFTTLKQRAIVLKYFLIGGRTTTRTVKEEEEYAKTLLRKYELIESFGKVDFLAAGSGKKLQRQYSVDRLSDHIIDVAGGVLYERLRRPEISSTSNTTNPDESNDRLQRHLEIVRDSDIRQEITDLLAAIKAHYMRSNVPPSEWPASWELTPQTKEELPRKLFEALPEITSCGYRLGTFHVVLNENTTKTTEEIKRIVHPVLEEHGNGNDSTFVVRYSPEEPRQLLYCSVGSHVSVGVDEFERTGSVGGFARRNGALHVLTAKHVASMTDVLKVRSDANNDTVPIGEVLKASMPHRGIPVDIAAAKVYKEIADKCLVKFKDPKGLTKDSLLYDFAAGRIRVLDDIPVYIWGAKSKPGRGVIRTPEQFMNSDRGQLLKYIVVENDAEGDNESDDEDALSEDQQCASGPKNFAKEGDSGSIVCHVDPDGKIIHVLSMLSGILLDKDKKGECRERKSYFTFYMTQGLTQLMIEQGDSGRFELC